VSFAAVTLCVASQRVSVIVVYFVITQSGNFWMHPPKSDELNKMSYTLNRDVFELNLQLLY